MQYSQKSIKICNYTFRDFKSAESYARIVYADTVATFGLMSPKTVKAARQWSKVQRILATVSD